MCETLHVGDIPLVVGFQPTGVGVVCTDKGCPSVVCIAETSMFRLGVRAAALLPDYVCESSTAAQL